MHTTQIIIIGLLILLLRHNSQLELRFYLIVQVIVVATGIFLSESVVQECFEVRSKPYFKS